MQRKKSGLENLVLISQIGINVMTPVFLCLIVGGWLDNKFGTSLMLPFLILGILSGAYCTYTVLKHRLDKEREEIEKEKAAQKEEWECRYGTGDGAGRNKRKGW